MSEEEETPKVNEERNQKLNKEEPPKVSKEEALKKGEELLRKQPDLKTKTEYTWSKKGAGPNFVMLCELLKGNAIPTKTLDLSSE